jgi:hypothetical protein
MTLSKTIASDVMLSFFKLLCSVNMLNSVIMLNVIMLNVIMLNAITLSVVAPPFWSTPRIACCGFSHSTLVSTEQIERIFIFVLKSICIHTLYTRYSFPFYVSLLPISFSYPHKHLTRNWQKLW